MLELLDYGLSEILLPTLLWVLVLTVSVIGAAVATIVLGAKQLRKSERDPFAFCLIIVVTHLIVLPLITVVLSASFSLNRSIANLLESGSQSLVTWSFDMGHAALQEHFQPLEQQGQIAVESVRRYTREQLRSLKASEEDGISLIEEGIFDRLVRALKLAFWKGTEVLVLELSEDVSSLSWEDLVTRTQEKVAQAIRDFSTPTVELLRAVAWTSLVVLGGVVLLFLGVVWLVLHIITRSKPSSMVGNTTDQESGKTGPGGTGTISFNLATENRAIDMTDLLNHLQHARSDYEYSLVGAMGTGIKVKSSIFSGALVSRAGNLVTVKPRPADPGPALLNAVLFGLPSSLSGSREIVKDLVECIEEEFE